MSKENLKIEFDNPPVHVTANGSLSIAATDIFHSKAGQDIIFLMEKIPPIPTGEKKAVKQDQET